MVYTVPGRPPNHQIDEQIASRPINNSELIQCISPGESFVETNYYTPQPAKPRIKISTLVSTCVVLPGNEIFIDRNLPELKLPFTRNDHFPPEYFVELHNSVIAGSYLNFDKSNFMGARIPLSHCKLNIQNWRRYLVGYDQPEILQHLEFGFPLGLRENPPPELKCSLQNHASAYQYYDYIDHFISKGLTRGELTGPFRTAPFPCLHISPLMTAPKKPDGRRAVFDATFGEFSLNRNTISDMYLDTPCLYNYPKVDDFRDLIVREGQGSYIWKRDLSRFYLQIPLDPREYPRVCYIWRNRFFFFTSLMFGLTHSGLQGQKVTTAVTWIHRRLGLDTDEKREYNSMNYSDDIGGCERTKSRAVQSFNTLGELLHELNLIEEETKAHPPATSMPYLGVQFDTVSMTMSIPGDKLEELRSDLSSWVKRKRTNKQSLQSILGKLFWVSRCVQFSRGFMGRLLSQLRELHAFPARKSVALSQGAIEDLQWWSRYLRYFNGTELIYPNASENMSLSSMIKYDMNVCCGDAQPNGGGAYYKNEYWSTKFPEWIADDNTPIHIKEFWVVIVSTAMWGHRWKGQVIYLFSDNQAVVDVLERERPRDPNMLALLREFLYLVCTRRFTPVFRYVDTKSNFIADFLSREQDQRNIDKFIESKSLLLSIRKDVPTSSFQLNATW